MIYPASFWLRSHVLAWILLGTFCVIDATARSPRAPAVVYTFDARALNQLDLRNPAEAARLWDTIHLLATLQGLANRSAPQFYLFYCSEFGVDTDQFWFDWLRKEDGWLKETELRPLKTLAGVLDAFHAHYQGLVVYDPAVPATSNLASTAAGCEDLLPVRFSSASNSLFQLLVHELKLPVKLWLVNPDGTAKFTGRGTIPDSMEPSTGSAKGDAYRWALARYARGGKCDGSIAAYYLDAFWLQHPGGNATMHTLSNHDFFVARRAFFFDLSPWGDELPGDDPQQPLGLDRRLLLETMQALYARAGGGVIRVGGFPPWPYKYTTHSRPAGRHDGVPTEWEYGRLISQFNGYMEADAAGLGAMANASFFQHYPLASRYRQPNRKPIRADWKARGYLTRDGKVANHLYLGHYVGDYDAPSWLYKAVAAFFPDPARGQVPMGWAFDPNLADRAPQALAYAYRHATTNDFFIAGDSGAGYLNPRALTVRPQSGLPSGLEKWTRHCQSYYRRWDMTITGFILDGDAGASTEREFRAYRSFSPNGAGTHFDRAPQLHSAMATCPERDLPDDVAQAAEVVVKAARSKPNQPSFLWARSILKAPRWYADLSRQITQRLPQGEVAVVGPYTFFALIQLRAGEAGTDVASH